MLVPDGATGRARGGVASAAATRWRHAQYGAACRGARGPAGTGVRGDALRRAAQGRAVRLANPEGDRDRRRDDSACATARTVRRTRGEDSGALARWRRIATEAAEQSGRGIVPDIPAPLTCSRSSRAGRCWSRMRAWRATRRRHRSRRSRRILTAATLFIGPEGGFAEDEVAAIDCAVRGGRGITRAASLAGGNGGDHRRHARPRRDGQSCSHPRSARGRPWELPANECIKRKDAKGIQYNVHRVCVCKCPCRSLCLALRRIIVRYRSGMEPQRWKIDLHAHTWHSRDCPVSPERLVIGGKAAWAEWHRDYEP